MTLTIQLEPELEAGLLAQARAEGMEVSAYVQDLVRAGKFWLSPQIPLGQQKNSRPNSG